MKAVGVRELKDRLSAYLEEVRRGEVLLVTDRGVVVAEIRTPSDRRAGLSPLERRLEPWVEKGVLSQAAPLDPSAYGRSALRTPAAQIDEALAASRDER
jgi:antitoxin (DNA-binding transcriptional repressor) of toxin-antitoxin stability system